jgi:hypothetical protein
MKLVITSNEANMESILELEAELTDELIARGLERANGQLAFTHRGQSVALKADKTIYRGFYVTVRERGYTVREFRSSIGSFDWDAVAESIIDVAERRLATDSSANIDKDDALDHRMADESLPTGHPPSPTLSLEPSRDQSGRVRVRLQDLHLDPVTALRLCAAVTRALSPEQPPVPRGAQSRPARTDLRAGDPLIAVEGYPVSRPSDAVRHI